MTQIPVLKFIYDRHNRSSASHNGSIELQITFHRRAKFMATGICVLPNEWKNGQVVNRFDAKELNTTLDFMMTNARRIVNEIIS